MTLKQLAEMKKKRISIEGYLKAQADCFHYYEVVEKIEDILENVDRKKIEKGKSHMLKLIKSKLTYDDEDDMSYHKNLEGLIDDYYSDHGLDSEGKERAD